MALNRSDESPFESRFGGGWLTPGQYLAENMVDRKARSQKKVLPNKFWESDEGFKREFLLQLRQVSGLLRLYSVDAILKALRSPGGKRVYSFAAKWLDPLIADEQRKIDVMKLKTEMLQQERSPVEPEVAIGISGPRPQFERSQKTPLDKLRALDG